MAPASELLVFMSIAPELSFFHNMAPALAAVCFYILIFSIVVVCFKLTGE